MILLEKKIDPTPEELETIKFFNGPKFPLYYQVTTSQKYWQYAHGFISRDKSYTKKCGIQNSEHTDKAISMFNRICYDNGIVAKTIYRASCNSTEYNSDLHCDIHTDHDFDHYIFVMYLNEFDFGYTYLFDKDDNMVYTIRPELYKVVIFKNTRHAQGFCRPGQRRMILVVTFEMDE